MNKKETIILAMTPDMLIYESFVRNLEFLNFEVILVCNTSKQKYKSIWDKIQNAYRKKILKDKKAKENLFQRYEVQDNLKLLDNKKSDYGLTIRADLFDEKVIKKIESVSKKNYCYHWDGLSRHPKIYNLIEFFNKFYVFDKNDLLLKYKTYPTTNFYFDCYTSIFENSQMEYDVYFIGSNDTRIERLITICEFLKSKNLKLKIILSGERQDWLEKYDYLTFIEKPLSYFENIKMISKSRMLLDINHLHLHKGLSFRAFESLGYDKKLITTNDEIINYDFYNEDNIFVIQNNLDQIDQFLSKKYNDIKPEIKFKYSFTNWIKYILEKENKIDISIPEKINNHL